MNLKKPRSELGKNNVIYITNRIVDRHDVISYEKIRRECRIKFFVLEKTELENLSNILEPG